MSETPSQTEPIFTPEQHSDQLHTVHYLGSMPKDTVFDLLGHGEKGHTDGSEFEVNELLVGPERTNELASLYFDATKFSAQYFDAPLDKQISIVRDGLLDEIFESLEALSGQGSKPDISEGGDILWFACGYLRLFGLRLDDVDLASPANASSEVADMTKDKEFIDSYLAARQENARNRLNAYVAAADEETIDVDKLHKLEAKVSGLEQSKDFVSQLDLGSKPRGAHQNTSPSYAQVFDLMRRFGESQLWNKALENSPSTASGISPLEQMSRHDPAVAKEITALVKDIAVLTQDITGYSIEDIMAMNIIKTHGRQHIRDKDPTAHRVDAVSQVGLDNRESDGTFEETNIVEVVEAKDGMVDVYMHEGRTDEHRHAGSGELHPATRRQIGKSTLSSLVKH